MNRKYAWILFLLPSLLGVTVFCLLPFLDVVRRSFLTAVTGEWNGVGNYLAVFQNQAFQLAVKNTVRFTLVCLPLLIGTGLFLAVQISKIPAGTVAEISVSFSNGDPGGCRSAGMENDLLGRRIPERRAFDAPYAARGRRGTDFMGTGAAFWVLVFSYLWKNLGYTVCALAGRNTGGSPGNAGSGASGRSRRTAVFLESPFSEPEGHALYNHSAFFLKFF